MPLTALVLLLVFLALTFGLRSFVQWRRTGSTGFRGISGEPGTAEWLGGVLFVAALGAALLAPLCQLLGFVDPVPALDRPAAHSAGLVLAVCGTVATLWSQFAMGDAWRIGVDEAERTTLVVRGPFGWVRNPIFTGMCLGVGGLALMVPNLLAVFAFVALVLALQLQVRRVEEPYLLRAHGAAYAEYAARTGRFVPGLGRLATGGELRIADSACPD
jgi:protein-S-isoprenylcysteine O-methyltransferase Ste14